MIVGLEKYKNIWNLSSSDQIKPGLDAIKDALKLLGNPQDKLSVVHIAGTNGKGSTLTFIEQIARCHGLTVGKFMSPCIVDVHDQIQANGEQIIESELDQLFEQMKGAGLSGKLTDFELLTCAAFLYFAYKKVDLVLLETGMGGRDDCTNVVTPIVSVITSIALEHTKFLGPDISSIASHKAGIIKERKPVVVGPLPAEAMIVIEKEASDKNARLVVLGDQIHIIPSTTGDFYKNEMNGLEISHLVRTLPGNHQAENLALAITAFLEVAKHFAISIDVEKVKEGVLHSTLQGRFEQVFPNVYFDGAHNPASAQMLVNTIKQQFPDEQIRFVIGMLADKDVRTVLTILETVSDEFYFVDFSNSRAMNAEEMMNLSKAALKTEVKDSKSFLNHCINLPGKTIVTGSLYLLTDLRQRF
ncbi:bifunctional folylpolyglutamate synthase/dihydrofolate synthase [Ureibacillus xyleni]|uniref:bifunctional folylpolyglutamate synthase/dihydrofolate synthase n=1 Tax=Ureibacillus xyleni TaxID=614648 RepID=UPI00192A5008|nr:folylpolyglutamate synthase/dihydrofolate synthase family protein [Ureibacillus xyleni]